jgi:hypothetical protein
VIRLLFALFTAHALFDFPLQGEFLSKGKNHTNPLPGVPWYQCLFAHSLIQAGAVAMITGSPVLALAELIVHAITDYAKSEKWISFNVDQAIHYASKVLWAVLLWMAVRR